METTRGEYAIFFCIIFCAAILRLWRLEIPSLWFDEALVAMVAKLPAGSVVSRPFESDIHPPFFHLLTKAFLALGESDLALRLPSVLAGLASTWLCWRMGRDLVSKGAGLGMAAVCAVMPWQVLLSRQLRPYSMLLVCFLLCFWFLAKTARGGKTMDSFMAGAALGPAILMYYGSLLAAGAAFGVLAASWIVRRTGFRHLLAFAGAVLIPAAVITPFLAGAMGHEQGASGGGDRLALAAVCLEKLGHLLFRENNPWARGLLAAAAVMGCMKLWRENKLVALVSLGWFAMPLAALIAAGYNSYFNPWHLTFLLPALVLWLGVAASAAGWALVPAAACATAFFIYAGGPFYFNQESHGARYKEQAKELAGSSRPGLVYIYPENSITGPLNWYLDRFCDPNPLRAQTVGPDAPTILAAVPGSLTPARAIARSPVQTMGALPFKTHITCAPDDFLARVHRFEYVACQPVLENILVAAQARRTGFAEFVFAGPEQTPQMVTVHFGFSNRKSGNRFSVQCRFDDEPWPAVFQSAGPDPRGHEKLTMLRDAPYGRLTVRFELFRDGSAFSYTGEDLEAVRLIDFKVEAVAAK
jgi:hypothetical protein